MDIHKLEATLRVAEAVRAAVYDDATGVPIVSGSYVQGNPTVGVGRDLVANPLSVDEINFLLDNDIERSLVTAHQIFGDLESWTDARQRAVVEAIFCLGPSRFREFVHAIAALQAQNWDEAASQILNSAWAQEDPARVGRIATMIRTGQDAAA